MNLRSVLDSLGIGGVTQADVERIQTDLDKVKQRLADDEKRVKGAVQKYEVFASAGAGASMVGALLVPIAAPFLFGAVYKIYQMHKGGKAKLWDELDKYRESVIKLEGLAREKDEKGFLTQRSVVETRAKALRDMSGGK